MHRTALSPPPAAFASLAGGCGTTGIQELATNAAGSQRANPLLAGQPVQEPSYRSRAVPQLHANLRRTRALPSPAPHLCSHAFAFHLPTAPPVHASQFFRRMQLPQPLCCSFLSCSLSPLLIPVPALFCNSNNPQPGLIRWVESAQGGVWRWRRERRGGWMWPPCPTPRATLRAMVSLSV